jgi:acyl carrier protein
MNQTSKDLFFKDLSEILQREEMITGNERIEEIEEWDSLAVLGILSLLEDDFNLEMSTEDLDDLENIQQLIDLIENNANK